MLYLSRVVLSYNAICSMVSWFMPTHVGFDLHCAIFGRESTADRPGITLLLINIENHHTNKVLLNNRRQKTDINCSLALESL